MAAPYLLLPWSTFYEDDPTNKVLHVFRQRELLEQLHIENELLYLKGSIPGSKNSEVLVKGSVKNISKMTITEKLAAAEQAKKTADKKKK